jgi:zinc transport system permease protein
MELVFTVTTTIISIKMTLILLTIIAISILLAPMGCIMLWHRYNYFHDGLVHACLFSGVVSYFFDTPPIISMIVVAIMFTTLVFVLKFYSNKNAVVSLVSTAFLAISIILASKLNGRALFDTMLFGDIFIIEWKSFFLISTILILMLTLLWKYLSKIVTISLDSDIAQTSKISIHKIEFAVLLILALIIAVSIKLIGAFLIGALLIIPAIGARLVAQSPSQMIIIAIVISIISGLCGFIVSLRYDWPLSPSISIMSIITYMIISFIKRFYT